MNTWLHSNLKPLSETIYEYYNYQGSDKESDFIQELHLKIQNCLKSRDIKKKINGLQHLLFLDLIGYDTTWSDFEVLEIMEQDNISTKFVSYTVASQIWKQTSDVVLMATNRLQKDLISSSQFIVSSVLNAITNFLNPIVAQNIAPTIIKLITSCNEKLKQKAIASYFHVCLNYNEGLKIGFQTLRNCLDDQNQGVILATLNVICELCLISANSFVPMIPKLYKLLEDFNNNSIISIKLIQILTMLAIVEKRLVKKLTQVYINIIESSNDMVLYQISRSIVEIPITNQTLLLLVTKNINGYLNHPEQTYRSLFTSMLLRILKLNPRLSSQYRELIQSCLYSDDKDEQLIALDLLTSMVNSKTIDSIADKMLELFKIAYTVNSRDQILTKLIMICSENDYSNITDFDWYISILMEFMQVNGISCFKVIGNQLLDLFIRVPSTRKRLLHEANNIFNINLQYDGATPLLNVVAHIIGESSNNFNKLKKIFENGLLKCNERVQLAFITAFIKLYIKFESNPPETINILKILSSSNSIKVCDEVNTVLLLVDTIENDKEFHDELKSKIFKEEDLEEEQLEIPKEIQEPIPLFENIDNDNDDSNNDKMNQVKMTAPKRNQKAHNKKRKPNEIQLIGKNDYITIETERFGSKSKQIMICIKIKNNTNITIESIKPSFFENTNISLSKYTEIQKIESFEETEFHVIFNITNPELPQFAKIVFSPSVGEEIETKIKIFPSFFIKPSTIEDTNIDDCTEEDELMFKTSIDIKVLLKYILSIMNSKVYPSDTNNSFDLISKTTYGKDLIGHFQEEDGVVSLILKSSSKELISSILKEIQMKITTLS